MTQWLPCAIWPESMARIARFMRPMRQVVFRGEAQSLSPLAGFRSAFGK